MGTQTTSEQPAVEEVASGVFEFQIGEKERAKYRAADEQQRAQKNVDFSELHKLGENELAELPMQHLQEYIVRVKKNHVMQKGRQSPQALYWAMRLGVVDRAMDKAREKHFKKISEEGSL